MHKIRHVLKSERIILKIRNTIKDCWEKSLYQIFCIKSWFSNGGSQWSLEKVAAAGTSSSRKSQNILSLQNWFLNQVSFCPKTIFFSRTKPDHSHRSIKLMRFTRINYRGPERTMRVDVRTFGVLFPRGSSGQRLRKWWSMVPELDIIQGCSKLCNICR